MTKVKQLTDSPVFSVLPDDIDVAHEQTILDDFHCAYRMGSFHLSTDSVRNHAIHIDETLIFTKHINNEGETHILEFVHQIDDSFYDLDQSSQRNYLKNLCKTVRDDFQDKLKRDYNATE